MDDDRTEHVAVMTTTDDPHEAATLARGLVEARLAACVQAMPIASTYRWEGAVETADEQLLLVKTRADQVDAVKAFLAEHHSYDTPECVVIPVVDGLPAYLSWIDESVDHEGGHPRVRTPGVGQDGAPHGDAEAPAEPAEVADSVSREPAPPRGRTRWRRAGPGGRRRSSPRTPPRRR